MLSKTTLISGIVLLILAISVVCIVLFIGNNQISGDSLKPHYLNNTIPAANLSLRVQTPIENIIINAEVPPHSESFTVYTGTYRQGDKIKRVYGDWTNTSIKNETPADVAPELARRALEPVGGLPSDAILAYSKVNYAETGNPYTGEVYKREPTSTFVFFERAINGTPIVGMSDGISVIFGGDGEVLEIRKHWRTLEYAGTVPIISVDEAIKKLEHREIINPPQGPEDAVVTSISIRYYAKSWSSDEILLEPVWDFYAIMPSGNPYEFLVYARQFVNFTATPTDGKATLTVTFTDTSDASPTKWHWDFGDGTNSTEQNPVHAYTTAGNYNVSLRAWNDLGSDTMEKTGYITVTPKTPPIANFMADPISGTVPLNVTFIDASTSSPTGWTWNFGDGTNATLQNPMHTYTSVGNYTVSLNVTNEDGADSMTRTDYIIVSNPPPTTQPTTIVTTTVTTTITTKPTTKPTPTKIRAPISPMVILSGLACAGLAYIKMKKN